MTNSRNATVASCNTLGATQLIETDIVEFLSSKHTENATISVVEVMNLYNCPEDRARRVLKSLEEDKVIALQAKDVYVVTI